MAEISAVDRLVELANHHHRDDQHDHVQELPELDVVAEDEIDHLEDHELRQEQHDPHREVAEELVELAEEPRDAMLNLGE
ncbi:MAG: hypothetical protein OEV40_30930 [Acidimicrobiia bacterium]|nr:hypothetical protein [Acidimicrobiia bacterium]